MKVTAKLLETNLVSIHEDEVTVLVQINGVELHVGVLGEGGHFIAHKPPGEGMDLVKVKLVVGREDVNLVPHVRIPVVYPNNSLWSSVDCSRSRHRDIHDVFQSKLDITILEDFQDLVGVLDGGGDSILFRPFGGLGDDMPLILPFLFLRLELFFAVRVDDGGMRDGLGRGRDQDCCVGDGGRHCLGHVRDKAPEDIRRNVQSRRLFVAVVLMPSFPLFHCLPSLLCRFISWV